MANPLTDYNFLEQLMSHNEREIFARITALSFNEQPLEFIEGKVTGGSINVDGNSAVRRTCKLSLVAEDVNINDFYWGLNNKFKLEIGLKNKINLNYPNIIWFKQGIYVITSFKSSLSTNKYTIDISGKDKMCLLNGEVSGILTAPSYKFHQYEIYDKKNDTITYVDIPIKDIIRNIVQVFGGELAQNIIINDIDECGLQRLEYRGDIPLYILKEYDTGNISNMTIEDKDCKIILGNNQYQDAKLSSAEIVYDTLSAIGDEIYQEPTKIKLVLKSGGLTPLIYTVIKIDYGMTPGYKMTDLTYAGELIANIGNTLTSVLDKIKTQLVNFEYFYDVDGHFIFQKKAQYITTPWGMSDDEIIYGNYANSNVFNFSDNLLITTFNNTPNLLNLKNDFSVMGTHKTVNGTEIPVHMRYGICKKPTSYQPVRILQQTITVITLDNNNKILDSSSTTKLFDAPYKEPYDLSQMRYEKIEEKIEYEDTTVITYTENYYANKPYTTDEFDWRELLYQMAIDYNTLNLNDDTFTYKLAVANPQYPTGKTGYEQYYTDISGFWRDMYTFNPEIKYTSIAADKIKDFSNLYVNNYFYPVVDKNLYSYKDCYAYYSNLVKVNDEIVTINGIYPFIESQCHINCRTINGELQASTTYYFKDAQGNFNKGTTDISILKNINIEELYIKNINNDYVKFVEQRFKEYSGQLYIKNENNILYTDLIKLNDSHLLLHDSENKFIQDIITYSIDKFNNINLEDKHKQFITYYISDCDFNNDHWKKDISKNPENLVFWLDFLDVTGAEIEKYSSTAIGIRSKAINDKNAKSIYYRDTPSIIFKSIDEEAIMSGYTYIQLQPAMESLFVNSSKGKSIKDRIDELVYNHLYCIETITVQSVPVYYLQPNTKIIIQDAKTGINGEYYINKLTIPLDYKGIMNITAVKTVDNIL